MIILKLPTIFVQWKLKMLENCPNNQLSYSFIYDFKYLYNVSEHHTRNQQNIILISNSAVPVCNEQLFYKTLVTQF